MTRYPLPRLVALLLTGAAGGILSGAFGIGGGIIMVPLIVHVLGYEHRRAAATSLAAIVPAAASGALAYGLAGNVSWAAGAALAAGGMAGSLAGTALLHRLSPGVARVAFVGALLAIAVVTLAGSPHRQHGLGLTLGVVAVAVAVGVGMGFASGLLGIGGGVIAVPLLILALGTSDVLAKGTSLLAIIPTALVGTLANAHRGLVRVPEGLTIGVGAAVASVPGVAIAHLMSPRVATVAFVCLLVAIVVTTLARGRLERGEA